MSGWIKLHRQFKDNGHFHMPDRAMKIWFYILLTVAHKDEPRWGIRAGEGWISYDMIADECSAEGSRMSRKAIARELQWLEGNGYISRFVIKGKGQKIRVVNWDVYQASDVASSETEPEPELVPEPLPELVPEHIQEPKEPQEPKEDNTPPTPPRGAASNGNPPVPVEEIVEHLNQRTGKRYRASSGATRRHIVARWREGFTLDDFITVIDKKAAAWMGTDMEPYLRPQTLFGTKFEAYLNEPWPGTVRPRDAPPRAAPRESAVDRRLRELGVTFRAGA